MRDLPPFGRAPVAPMIVDSQGSQSEHTASGFVPDDPWDAFERNLKCLYGINRLVDHGHGGHPDCFFNCIRAHLRTSGISPVPSVEQLRKLLADELRLMHPDGIPEGQWEAVQAAVQSAQPNLVPKDWSSYLHRLRKDLYGGDLEIGAVQHWMRRVHGREVNISIFTPTQFRAVD